MLNNTNMGGGDGRPKYLHILQVKLEKVIISEFGVPAVNFKIACEWERIGIKMIR